MLDIAYLFNQYLVEEHYKIRVSNKFTPLFPSLTILS